MRYRFSLRRKLNIFTTVLAVITYSTSAFFIYVIQDYIRPFWNVPEQMYVIIILLLGIIWSGILAAIAARLITKPLQRLEAATTRAAEGDLNQEIEIPRSDDEIKALSIAVDTMFKNIKQMVHNIENHFNNTNKTVLNMKEVSKVASEHSTAISGSTEDISKGAVGAAEAMRSEERRVGRE